MKNSLLITLTIGLVFLSLPALANEALSAKEIMQKVDERYTGDTLHQKLTMVLIDKRGSQRKRKFIILSKTDDAIDQSLVTFLSPADVRGTRFLSYDWSDDAKENDAWIYLPTLRKTKRLPASDRTGAFLGSDFSYSDFEDVELSHYDYEMIDDNCLLNHAECWLIERVPRVEIKARVEKQTGYQKELLWVNKTHFIVVQKKGWFKHKKIKYFKVNEIEIIDGIATDTKLQMITTKNGQLQHKTLIIVNETQYNLPIDDNRFSAAALNAH